MTLGFDYFRNLSRIRIETRRPILQNRRQEAQEHSDNNFLQNLVIPEVEEQRLLDRYLPYKIRYLGAMNKNCDVWYSYGRAEQLLRCKDKLSYRRLDVHFMNINNPDSAYGDYNFTRFKLNEIRAQNESAQEATELHNHAEIKKHIVFLPTAVGLVLVVLFTYFTVRLLIKSCKKIICVKLQKKKKHKKCKYQINKISSEIQKEKNETKNSNDHSSNHCQDRIKCLENRKRITESYSNDHMSMKNSTSFATLANDRDSVSALNKLGSQNFGNNPAISHAGLTATLTHKSGDKSVPRTSLFRAASEHYDSDLHRKSVENRDNLVMKTSISKTSLRSIKNTIMEEHEILNPNSSIGTAGNLKVKSNFVKCQKKFF